MKSDEPGAPTSKPEVTNISANGVWMLIDERELFLPFDQFPWFKEAAIGSILDVKRVSKDHLYWPILDVDLSIGSIERPEDYPLVSGTGESRKPASD